MVDRNGDSGLIAALAWQGGHWMNQPQDFVADDTALHVVTDAGSDFWQETFYGFKRDAEQCGHHRPIRLGHQPVRRESAGLTAYCDKTYDNNCVMDRDP